MKSLASTKVSVKTIIRAMVFCALTVFVSASQAQINYYMPPELVKELQAKYPDGLPRYMTPEEQEWIDQQRALEEKTIGIKSIQPPNGTMPPTGATWTPAEYEPLAGILVRWTTGSSYDTPLRGMVEKASKATQVWCLVESASQATAANSAFSAAGADMNYVTCIPSASPWADTDSIWIRDYGPRYMYVNNSHAIMDHVYNRSGRPADDAINGWIANYWADPCYKFDLWHGGGNFHCFSDGNSFGSSLILDENPAYTRDDINDIFRDYFNVNHTIFPRLVSAVDATGHLDMWFMPLGPNKVLISLFSTNTNGEQTTTNNAATLMAARGYTVYRVPAWNSGGTHYTYTNAVIINGRNKRVIIPQYAGSYTSQDANALAVFTAAMPDYTIVQQNCSAIIGLAGAVHCIMKHVYAPTTPVPTVEVLWPNGGETLLPGASEQIEWVASDDVNVTSIDLYYSTNAGSTWNTIATGLSNTGSYNWTVPATASTQYRIRAVARDASANSRQDLSDNNFTVTSSDPPVSIIGNWVIGTNHPKEPGNNRELIVFAYAEGSTTVDLTGMTYGEQTMTQINERVQGTSTYVYTTAYRLGEAGIAAATSGTISPTWTGTRTGTNYISVFLSDVDQTTPVGANAVNSTSTGATTATTALATQNGDMVFDAATNSNAGNYTSVGTGFTEVNEPLVSGGDAVVGYKSATGSNETPSVTHSTTNGLQSIVGFVLQHALGSVSPPGQATTPVPANLATDINVTTAVSWTAGSGATSHDVYFGTASTPPFVQNQAGTSYDPPGSLATSTNYYWRIDEKNTGGTTTGTVWRFTTVPPPPGQAGSPSPANGAANVGITQDLSWAAGSGIVTSRDVYFGTVNPPVTKVIADGTVLTYDTGTMANGTTYYWRIDEKNAGGTTTGTVWSFTTIYKRTLTSSSTTGGDVTTPGEGALLYDNGTVVDLVATPDAHYHFVNWTGPVANPTSASTTITMNGDYTVVASFAIDTFTLNYAAGAGGTLTGNASQVVDYNQNGTAVEAVPDIGYHFVSWSDSSTANPRTDLNVTASIAVTASFAQSQFIISGTVMVAGSGLADVQMSGLPGDPCTDGSGAYTATVDSGFSAVVTPIKAGYIFDPNSRSYTNVTEDQTGQNYAALPADNFNDNRKGSMWRRAAKDSSTWLAEDVNVLNVGSSGWVNLISSCTGHWRMNDNAASTVVLDDSGNGKNGTARQNTSDLHTAGKIDGALTFNGTSDYIALGNVIGTEAYTKVAWVKREAGATAYNIISGNTGHALWAPHYSGYLYNNKLSAGHNNIYNIVQDTVPLDVNVWYLVAVTFDPNVSSGRMVLYKDGVEVNEANNVPRPVVSTNTYIGSYAGAGYYMKGAIDNAMIFNRALTANEITALYNQGNGTEVISGSPADASYNANGWSMDTTQDLAVSIDYHYSGISSDEGWTGITVGDDVNYVSISVGSENNTAYFYYEAVVDGSVVSEQEPRTSNDGTLFVSFDSASPKTFYLSHTDFGSGNAYDWQATNPTQGLWSEPVKVTLAGGSSGAALASGQAYLDNFLMDSASLIDWPPRTDLDSDGYIDLGDVGVMADNWLNAGQGDFDDNSSVNFVDYAELALAW